MVNKDCNTCQRTAELEMLLIMLEFDRDCLIKEKLRLLAEFQEYKRNNGK